MEMEDDIRKDWRDVRVNMTTSRETLDAIMQGKKRTALQDLAQRYLRFSNVAIVMLLCTPITVFKIFSEEFGTTWALWIGMGFDLVFLLSSIMDRWLCYKIRQLDVVTMAVSEIARKAALYKKRHLQFVAVLLPMAIAVCCAMAWASSDVYLIAGMVTGGVVGLALGISQLMKFLSDYHSLTE